MPSISLTTFGGRVPKMHEKLLSNHLAQTADNVDLREGNLKPMKAVTLAATHSNLTPKTLWKYGSTFFIFGDGLICSVVNSPVQESNDRFMYTGGGSYPKQSDSSIWTTERRLGVPPPTDTPVISAQGTPTSDIQDAVSYCFTMVTSWGEESGPSPVTAVSTIYGDQHVHLSNIDAPTGTGCDFAYKRIYRLASGKAGAEYMFIEQIAHDATPYDDKGTGDTLKAASADAIATTDWDDPPTTLAGLTMGHNGMLLGYLEKELYVSEPFVPYAMPDEYRISVDTDITGIAAGHEFILVLSSKHPYIVTGADPESLVSTKVNIISKCSSQRGMVSAPQGILYPSPDGLCLCDGSTVEIITKEYITREQWNTLMAGDLIATWYNNKYYAFIEGSNDGLIIDIDKKELTTFSLQTANDVIRDIYHNATDDTISVLLYDGSAHTIRYTFETSATNLVYTWKSKKWVDIQKYNCAKIKGDFTVANTYLEFKYILNGTVAMTKKIWIQNAAPTAEQHGDWWFDANDSYTAYYWDSFLDTPAWVANTLIKQGGMFRLPDDPGGSDKEIQLVGNLEVDSVQLATTAAELV